ncbi:MAG: hypothetical protein ABIS50_15220 [Luteolibacter sp.]|uniref:hypothetical protein n=1 Tax=Luteolibacter sp. TaxID=1962973 RepID=UPI0032656C8C
MAITIGVIGICAGKIMQPKPAKGFPPGRLRWKQRAGCFVLARVRTDAGIREFSVQEKDGFWMPLHERGRNDSAANPS